MDKREFVPDSNESRPSEVANTLLSNYVATSKNVIVLVLDCRKAGFIAEKYADAVHIKSEIIAKKSITHSSGVHGDETGGGGLLFTKLSSMRPESSTRIFPKHLIYTPVGPHFSKI